MIAAKTNSNSTFFGSIENQKNWEAARKMKNTLMFLSISDALVSLTKVKIVKHKSNLLFPF